ncbi:RNA binding protein [Cladophialophora carrionii]|uniref:RNA binding protein n=1 Tax=Cladophialophora carrionii TaxID=86049 RepID=A0A1C1CX93_9EURO|nr:RNA binding protein [Cladophialophora carrionii]
MSKKRKHEQIQDRDDLQITKPQPDKTSQKEVSAVPAKSKGQLKQEKSERRAKKQKKSKEEAPEQDASTDHAANVSSSLAPVAAEGASSQEPDGEMKRSKKDKKKAKKEKDDGDKKKAKKESDDGDEHKAKKEKDDGDKKSAPARFICFVGNLPYDATLDQINAHFSKIAPTSVRHATEKASGKSKGYAFLEFDHYDKMKTCLKLYHHSIFDPEAKGEGKDAADAQQDDKEQTKTSGKQKGRRINVELTAGGGGKSKARKARINSKNQKLEEERGRRRLKEKAEREQGSRKHKAPPETGANTVEVKDTRGDIHPSRLSRVSH